VTPKQSDHAPEDQAHLVLDNIVQRFGSVTALDGVSLRIRRGEFVTLLGPSGCGKTTLLRSIAGFVVPTSGRVLLAGQDVTRLPAHRRPTNMVFQRPTLFPHLDVGQNVAFGLRVAGVARQERDRRVLEALELVGLAGYEHRRSHEISGGQMQRVALARALVMRPEVLLLDEPLSALDLRIRLQMEAELRRVHRETGATFVYVTHDQREALALSDRIVVFDQGHIEQVGAPGDVYKVPSTEFTARFVGDANLVPVEVVETEAKGAVLRLGPYALTAPDTNAALGPAWLVVRPEAVKLSRNSDEGLLRGVIGDVAYRGSGFAYVVEVPGLSDPIKAEIGAGTGVLAIGSEVGVGWDRETTTLLSRGPES